MTRPGYEPYQPQSVPVRWSDGIWTVEGPEIGLRVCACTIPCPTRMTIVRLAGGRLWLHSPIAPSQGLMGHLAELGEVAFLVAPNRLHRTYVARWAEAFPSAQVVGFAGDEAWSRMGSGLVGEWQDDFDWTLFDLGRFSELAFFHRRSRTVIVADLMQAFEAHRVRPRLARVLLVGSGAVGPDLRPSLEIRWAARVRRAATITSVQHVLAWQPQAIIISHGPNRRSDAIVAIRKAFAWL